MNISNSLTQLRHLLIRLDADRTALVRKNLALQNKIDSNERHMQFLPKDTNLATAAKINKIRQKLVQVSNSSENRYSALLTKHNGEKQRRQQLERQLAQSERRFAAVSAELQRRTNEVGQAQSQIAKLKSIVERLTLDARQSGQLQQHHANERNPAVTITSCHQ